MKKILYSLLVISLALGFNSCSGDDEDKEKYNEHFTLKIKGEECEHMLVSSMSYQKNNYHIFLTSYVGKFDWIAGNMKCPNGYYNHKTNNSLNHIAYGPVDKTGINYSYVLCEECKSFFVLPSGNPVDLNISKGIEMYNVSYDESSQTYIVSK
jgi:uncharacterized CHY-type Zn-finger protein